MANLAFDHICTAAPVTQTISAADTADRPGTAIGIDTTVASCTVSAGTVSCIAGNVPVTAAAAASVGAGKGNAGVSLHGWGRFVKQPLHVIDCDKNAEKAEHDQEPSACCSIFVEIQKERQNHTGGEDYIANSIQGKGTQIMENGIDNQHQHK